MEKARIVLCAFVLLGLAGLCRADGDIWERETLTDGFWGLNDKLAESGMELAVGATNIYQQNVRGGISKHRRAGRLTGSYDFELSIDAEKLLGIEGGSFYIHSEGSWPRADIDSSSVGSVFGVNGDAGGRRGMDVTELWYEQSMLDDTLKLRIGKLDVTGGFECRGCQKLIEVVKNSGDDVEKVQSAADVAEVFIACHYGNSTEYRSGARHNYGGRNANPSGLGKSLH